MSTLWDRLQPVRLLYSSPASSASNKVRVRRARRTWPKCSTRDSRYSSPVVVRERWHVALFVAVAALHLLPIWRVHLLPTVDGPSHLYNAVVLRELAAGTPEFSRVFEVNKRLSPNWLGHALLAVFPAAPLIAEKLLF